MIRIAQEAELLCSAHCCLVVATWMPNGVAGSILAAVRRVCCRPVAIAANPTGVRRSRLTAPGDM
jgi:hypothetical protein